MVNKGRRRDNHPGRKTLSRRAAFSRVAAGVVAGGLLSWSCTDSRPSKSSGDDQDHTALALAATRLMAKQVRERDLEVLKTNLDTKKYGIPTGYAERDDGPPIEYRFCEDGSVWAAESEGPNHQRQWIDCDPEGHCVSGIGTESLKEHLVQRDLAAMLDRFDRIIDQHLEHK